MARLVRDDEVTVLPICQVAGHASIQAETSWTARVRDVTASHVVMSVRTPGGIEVTMEASLSGIRRDQSGRWELVLPMFHRVVERTDQPID